MMGWNAMVHRSFFRVWIDPSRVVNGEADRVAGYIIAIKLVLTSGVTCISCQTFSTTWVYMIIVGRKIRTCHASVKRENVGCR